jgi:hypothetical protein
MHMHHTDDPLRANLLAQSQQYETGWHEAYPNPTPGPVDHDMIHIEIDRMNYSPGQQVINYANPNHLAMRLKGKEKVKWWIRHSERQEFDDGREPEDIEHYEKMKEERVCYDYRFNVATFTEGDTGIRQGVKIPFSFMLPEDLPSSFMYKWNDFSDQDFESYAKINYSIQVCAVRTFPADKEILKEKKHFFINQLPKQISQKQVETNSEVVSCCC